jgi:hypothetical protein
VIKQTGKGSTKSAWGQAVEEVTYDFEWFDYEKFEDVPPSSLPDKAEQLKWVNDKAKSAARQKKQDEALVDAGHVKPTLQNNEDKRVKQIAAALVAGGWSEEDALAHARSMQKPK